MCVSSCASNVRVTRVVVCSLLRVCRNTPRAIVCGSRLGANGLTLAGLQFFNLQFQKKILFCPISLHSLLLFICEFERCRMGVPICHSNYTPGVHYIPIDWRELGTLSNCSNLCRFQGPVPRWSNTRTPLSCTLSGSQGAANARHWMLTSQILQPSTNTNESAGANTKWQNTNTNRK